MPLVSRQVNPPSNRSQEKRAPRKSRGQRLNRTRGHLENTANIRPEVWRASLRVSVCDVSLPEECARKDKRIRELETSLHQITRCVENVLCNPIEGDMSRLQRSIQQAVGEMQECSDTSVSQEEVHTNSTEDVNNRNSDINNTEGKKLEDIVSKHETEIQKLQAENRKHEATAAEIQKLQAEIQKLQAENRKHEATAAEMQKLQAENRKLKERMNKFTGKRRKSARGSSNTDSMEPAVPGPHVVLPKACEQDLTILAVMGSWMAKLKEMSQCQPIVKDGRDIVLGDGVVIVHCMMVASLERDIEAALRDAELGPGLEPPIVVVWHNKLPGWLPPPRSSDVLQHTDLLARCQLVTDAFLCYDNPLYPNSDAEQSVKEVCRQLFLRQAVRRPGRDQAEEAELGANVTGGNLPASGRTLPYSPVSIV